MTTQSGEGGKQAASPNPPETIHLISDHDSIGEPLNWCREESFKSTETFAQTTCIGCLKTVKIYAEGAAERLKQLQAPKAKSRKGRKRHIDRDSGADGHNGVWGT